ncbi:3-oxoacyl-[acyl-carrier-protein] synthase III C-terminal domain-containing protein [Bdellovibrio sp. NC01]|uniref:3-oxoacyl-[acyl-carrier-protein] synthase III C-terminal domain-containing protein n=1 Tax=Bdellovibrio sp. NC01 TaxID=2220073 RepID=UPI001159FE3A|nr:3-oxoacyl-[acyl-carrier-protein] synthase III C-terminal domain-containing protein [Bdellovibrio sp. NC01]QDK36420.1 naringenin-chalcone synthase [Bdellovibrio sp. NC01]
MYLQNFLSIQPPYSSTQEQCFRWLSEAHEIAQQGRNNTQEEYLKLFHRVGCSEQQINQRFFFTPDLKEGDWEHKAIYPVRISARGVSMQERHEFYHKTVRKLFEQIYSERKFPDDIIHVSCTGYISPSAAQMEALKAPQNVTVTHSYHMGCYGAFPALRMASGFLANKEVLGNKKAVDLVHTELCSLHLNPQDPSLEQLVIQSLFADGCIAYSMSEDQPTQGFKLHSLYEELIPGTSDAMEWMVSDWGMKMTLSKDVPNMVGNKVVDFTLRWLHKRGFDIRAIRDKALFAVHPGGPKIIDQVKEKMELREDQVSASRELLRERGNMSSATLPHLWQKILNDDKIPSGTPIISYAFGPGLTICASYMEKI